MLESKKINLGPFSEIPYVQAIFLRTPQSPGRLM